MVLAGTCKSSLFLSLCVSCSLLSVCSVFFLSTALFWFSVYLLLLFSFSVFELLSAFLSESFGSLHLLLSLLIWYFSSDLPPFPFVSSFSPLLNLPPPFSFPFSFHVILFFLPVFLYFPLPAWHLPIPPPDFIAPHTFCARKWSRWSEATWFSHREDTGESEGSNSPFIPALP